MLDAIFQSRKYLLTRDDCLSDLTILFILIAIRAINDQGKSTNKVLLSFFLRANKRTRSFQVIDNTIEELRKAGYLFIKNGYQLHITEPGRQALKDIEKALKKENYTGKKKPKIKRPIHLST